MSPKGSGRRVELLARELFEQSPNVPGKWQDGWKGLHPNSRRHWRHKAREKLTLEDLVKC